MSESEEPADDSAGCKKCDIEGIDRSGIVQFIYLLARTS